MFREARLSTDEELNTSSVFQQDDVQGTQEADIRFYGGWMDHAAFVINTF